MALDPSFATMLGIPGHETEYRDYSPAGHDAMAAAATDTLDQLGTLQPADDVDRVTVHAMRERLGLDLEVHQSGWDLADLNNIACAAQDIRAIFDLMPTSTVEQWEHIAGRLANVPAAIDGYILSLRAGKERGLVAARRQVNNVIEQAERHTEDDGFFASFVADAKTTGPTAAEGSALDSGSVPEQDGTPAEDSTPNESDGTLPQRTIDQLASGADAARAAYAKLRDFLRDELLPSAGETDAVGRERYELASRTFLGSAVDLTETYAWGVAELDRIIAEQEQIADQIAPGASIDEAKRILNEDPARQLNGTKALQSWMQELSDRAVADLSDTHFDIPDIMKTIECRIAPTQEGGIYYTGPSEDFSRAGRMWWSVPAGEDSFTTWAETSTVYHEGVPGHHLQVATATYQSGLLNKWRRNVCWVSGHGEGWALYAERLMDQLGYLADPGDKMGMLDGQRMRAARVVFDIGVHLELEIPPRWGAGTWTAETGYEFLRKNLDISEGQLNFEFNRYLGWPGQAPSYKIGQRLWEQIRDELQQRDGQDFDLKAFHTKALNVGSMGLDSLKEALLG
ncbi:DUF885 domain-containing protein [Paenarthrobacter sp. Z7-10]|nr:DUF885 domain-containing protein [Paenarthrobacter sp. Z7-10]